MELPKLQVCDASRAGTKGFTAITDVETDGEHVYEELQTRERAEDIVHQWNCHDDLLIACQEQHKAIDRLFALLIEADEKFFPSKCGQPWDALLQGNAVIAIAEKK